MADPNTRQGKRTPVTLKIKFKSETIEQFIERYAVDVSQGGIFIRTKEPLAVGTQMRFEFQLKDSTPLIAGEGTVVWTRENDPSRPAIAPGMGVRFDRLAEGSQAVLERILAEKAKQTPGRPSPETTKPPMFSDTPTRVASAQAVEALLGDDSGLPGRTRPASSHPPMRPFQTDAEDFDEKAFDEATKVRSLDDLIAQTAGDVTTQTAHAPASDADARRAGRADSALSEPPGPDHKPGVPDRDSAPTLPSPPATGSGAQPRHLDTSPSPRSEDRSGSTTSPPALRETSEPAKTVLGVAPARAATPSKPPPTTDAAASSARSSVAADPVESSVLHIPVKRPSAAPILAIGGLVVAAALAAVWFFVLRDPDKPATTNTPPPTADRPSGSANPPPLHAGTAETPPPGPGPGSGVGSGNDTVPAGSSAPPSPTAVLADTTISVTGLTGTAATVEVVGTPHTGPAPLTAKLEKGKVYKARIRAPGFAVSEIDVIGGEAPPAARLAAKPRKVAVASEPVGAIISVDGAGTGKTTPATIELTKAQAGRKSVRIGLRKAGFRSIEKVVDTAAYKESDAEMLADLAVTLSPTPTAPPRPTNPGGTGSGGGSGTTGTDGTGSAATPSGTPPGGDPKPPDAPPADPKPSDPPPPAP